MNSGNFGKSEYSKLELTDWYRRSTFEFFRDYEDPFFNMTAQVDVTKLDRICSLEGLSFALSALYFSQETANSIEEFRIRMVDGNPVIFDRVEATQTILLDDESFGFCYFPWRKDLWAFNATGRESVKRYKQLATFDVETDRLDLIYYSVIPWVSFTSFKHARRFDNTRTVPRIVFGKKYEVAGKILMPVSVEANHILMDGIHVGRYFEGLQKRLDECDHRSED